MQEEKRISNCTACKTPLSHHDWGVPSRYCSGLPATPEEAFDEHKTAIPLKKEVNVDALMEEIHLLDQEEEALRKKIDEEELQRRITKKADIEELRSRRRGAADEHDHRPPIESVKDLRSLPCWMTCSTALASLKQLPRYPPPQRRSTSQPRRCSSSRQRFQRVRSFYIL